MLGQDGGAKVCECGNSWLLLGKECVYIYIYILISLHFAYLKSEFIINMLSSCVILLAFKMLI